MKVKLLTKEACEHAKSMERYCSQHSYCPDYSYYCNGSLLTYGKCHSHLKDPSDNEFKDAIEWFMGKFMKEGVDYIYEND